MTRHLLAAAFSVFATCAAAAATPAADSFLQLQPPDEPLLFGDEGDPGAVAALLGQRWNAARLDGRDLVLRPVTTLRNADWKLTRTHVSPSPTPTPIPPGRTGPVTALSLDAGSDALFAFRLSSDELGTPYFAPGRYPSLLPSAVTLRAGWSAPLSWRGRRWQLSTTHETRADGALLAGSMALVATDAAGLRSVLLAPARGMAFARQEIVWLGDIDGDDLLDFVVRRTRLTGEVEFVFVVGPWRGQTVIDPDRPDRLFESGVAESGSVLRHASQDAPPPAGRFGSAAFTIGEAAWNRMLAASDPALPAVLADRQLSLGDEKIRFTIEQLPRWQGEGPSSGEPSIWAGPVLVRVHFRGRSQVIMEAGGLDGGPFRVAVDSVAGRAALRIELQPNDNNSFVHDWVWSPADLRFRRLAVAQSQGC